MTAKNRYGSMPDPAAPTAAKKREFFLARKNGEETMWVNRTGARIIEGIASTATVCAHGDSLAPEGCRLRVPIPLLFRHGFQKGTRNQAFRDVEQCAIGEVFLIRKSKTEIYFRAMLSDTRAAAAAWKLITDGEARAASVAAKDATPAGVVDGVKYYSGWAPGEISVCFKGANPDCWCRPLYERR